MADIAQAMRYKIDVKNGLVKQPMTGVLMRGDKNANRIIAALYDGDKTVSLDGVTVTGKFFRGGDGIEIPLDGEASGNEAIVLLNEHCYAVVGYFEASVKLTTGSETRTILTITGHVESDGEGGILDIENVVPSVEDIVAQYQRMQEVTQVTESAAQAAKSAAEEAKTAAKSANFVVLGYFETLAQLQAAHPIGGAGDAYAVGVEQPYTVYIWDVDKAAWADIGHLQGAQGPKGEKGDTGAQGPKGEKGDTGAQGEKGDKGDVGPAGPQGPKGADGAMTFDDLTDEQRESLRGPRGYTGATGPQGLKGDNGADGATPVRGVDYWTDDDIATIKSYVDDAILGGKW